LEALKLEFKGIKPILFIGGAFAYMCDYYLVCNAFGNIFQIYKFMPSWKMVLRWDFTNSWSPTK